ncbi:MAG: DUF433 domain-containing protein [Anaerolineae bacterium]|nr:DUF433 domain-containing protein [Anaerolineae bacterium]
MFQPLTLTVPLREDEQGGLLVGKSTIPLERVIYAFNHGQTPESILASFPSLDRPDVYAVISYYLTNQGEVEDYIQRRQAEADKIRQEIDERFPTTELRQRLLARRPRN